MSFQLCLVRQKAAVLDAIELGLSFCVPGRCSHRLPSRRMYMEVRKLAWQKMASQSCWPFCLRFIGLWPRRFHVCFHGTGSLHLCPDVFVFFFAAVLVGRSCYGSGVAVSAFRIAMVRRIFEFHIFPANQRFEHPRVQSFAP